MRLHIKIVLIIVVTFLLLIGFAGFMPVFSQDGVITGRIMVPGPETTEDVQSWIPVTDAIVSLTDTVGDIHSVSTDEEGYYFFNNLAVNANCVITAIAVVNGKTMVFKDIIPHPVAANETYNAGTADAKSTALALIVDELIEQGLTYEDIDLEIIQDSDNFEIVEEQVLSVLEDNGNVMDDLGAGTAYNVTDIRADLSNLLVSEGTLDPDFSSNKTTYEVAVANYISSITFTPTAVEPETTIINVGGTTVASGVPSAPVILGVGANTIDIVVTAEDGITTKTYTVTVIRALSSNADLSSLSIDEGTLDPDFSSNTTTYEVAVTNSISSITFTPTAADDTAAITVNGIIVTSGVPFDPVSLSLRDNPINIVVTAEDKTTKIYTVTVIRNILKDNADLCNLSLSVGTLDPEFCCTTTSYKAAVGHSVESITFTPVTIDAAASVKVDGTTVENEEPPAPVSLDVGDNIIPIVVTAEDGISIKTYTVTVNRIPTPTLTMAIAEISTGSGTVRPTEGAHIYNYRNKVNIHAKAGKDSDFICWLQNANIENTTKANTRVTMNGDQTVTAIFNLNTYTITTSAGENGSISPSGDQILEHGSTPTFTISPAANYHIADVKVDKKSVGAVDSYTFENVTADHSIAATFAINTYTFTMDTDGNGTGTITVSPVKKNYDYGDKVNIHAKAGKDSDFTGWITNENIDNITKANTRVTMNGDQTVTAIFTLKDVTLTMAIDGSGSGKVVPAEGDHSYDHGDKVNIKAKADKDSVFTGWITNENIDKTTKANTKVTMDDDQTVTAIFTLKTYTITASTGANGSIDPSGEVTVNHGLDQSFTITPAPNYSIVDVLIDKKSKGAMSSYTFKKITADHTIEATFAGDLHHFDFAAISSPQTADTAFEIIITAKDVDENTVTGYTAKNTLSDTTGTIDPYKNINFSNGVWTGDVKITTAQEGVIITTDGDEKTGTSGVFDVAAGDLHHFDFAYIDDKTAGTPFNITITAKDSSGNTVTGYTETGDLSDKTGSIDPIITGNFGDSEPGVWNGDVTITLAQNNVVITIVDSLDSQKTGESNKFKVN